MKDKAIQKALLKVVDTSKPEFKNMQSIRKLFLEYLTKLNVSFYDTCCETASEEDIYPLRYNNDSGEIEYFDQNEWETISLEIPPSSGNLYIPNNGNAPQGLFESGAISLNAYLTRVQSDIGTAILTLADGIITGHIKKIKFVTDGGGNVIIIPATANVWLASVILQNVGDWVEVMWVGNSWKVIDYDGTVIINIPMA